MGNPGCSAQCSQFPISYVKMYNVHCKLIGLSHFHIETAILDEIDSFIGRGLNFGQPSFVTPSVDRGILANGQVCQ